MLEQVAAKLDSFNWDYQILTDLPRIKARLVVSRFVFVDEIEDELMVSFSKRSDFQGVIFFLQLISSLGFKFKVVSCHEFDEEKKEVRPADWTNLKENGDYEKMLGAA